MKKRTSCSRVACTTKVVAASIGIPTIGAVQGLADILEDVVLDEELSADASVDAVVIAKEAMCVLVKQCNSQEI
jgi:hypothetical protein